MNWQNTEQNVQCSSLSLYRQTVYSGQYSGHCVLLVLLIEWLLFIIRQYIWLCVDRLLVAAVSNWLTAFSGVLLKKLMFLQLVTQFPSYCKSNCSSLCSQQPLSWQFNYTRPVYFPAPFYFLKISFNNFILSMPSSSKCLLSLCSPQITLYALSSSIPPKCPHTSHLLIQSPSHIQSAVQIMKLLTMHLSPPGFPLAHWGSRESRRKPRVGTISPKYLTKAHEGSDPESE